MLKILGFQKVSSSELRPRPNTQFVISQSSITSFTFFILFFLLLKSLSACKYTYHLSVCSYFNKGRKNFKLTDLLKQEYFCHFYTNGSGFSSYKKFTMIHFKLTLSWCGGYFYSQINWIENHLNSGINNIYFWVCLRVFSHKKLASEPIV